MDPFLRQHNDLPSVTRRKLLQHLNKKMYLELELAISVDAGKPFVEGDGHFSAMNLQVQVVSGHLSGGNIQVQHTVCCILRTARYTIL